MGTILFDERRMTLGGIDSSRPGTDKIAELGRTIVKSPKHLRLAMSIVLADYRWTFVEQYGPQIDKIAFLDCMEVNRGDEGRIFEAVYRVTYRAHPIPNGINYIALRVIVDEDGQVFTKISGGYSTYKPEWYTEEEVEG